MKKTNTAKNPDVADDIGKWLMRRKETIAVAESVTTGLVQNALGSVENASLFFQGGLTAYNLGQKARHLRIDPIHAIGCDCVSEKVAAEMATNVCELFHSDWGLSVTGYAAPTPESHNKLFAFIGVAYRRKLLHTSKIIPPNDAPARIQQYYLSALLKKTLSQFGKSSE